MSRRYTAFISYRHADNTQEGRRWAEWLHRALERYVVPPDLIGTPNLRGEPIRDSLYPIFRDEDELPANADLATGIRAALEVSDHLIVLCSPRSAVSPWVRKEVREFKELGRSDRILAIIIAGEPNADDPAKAREGILRDEECFCEELRYGVQLADGTLDWAVRTEPIAADLRPIGTRAEGFVTAEAYREHLTQVSSLDADKINTRVEAYRHQLEHGILKVAAGLLDVPLGMLIDRDAAHRAELAKRELHRAEAEAARLRGVNRSLVSAGAIAMILALMAGWFWWRAGVEKQNALQAKSVAEGANKRTESALAESTRQLQRSRLEEGRTWFALASAAKNGGDHLGAIMLAGRAVGFQGYGRQPNETEAFAKAFPLLMGEPMTDPTTEQERQAEVAEVAWFIGSVRSNLPLPLWASAMDHSVICTSFSPDGSRLASGSVDSTIKIWDAATGKELASLAGHADIVMCVAFSPDGSRLASGSWDNTIKLWDTTSGKQLASLAGHKDWVTGVAFSPDGSRLASGSWDKMIKLWNTATGKELTSFAGHTNAARELRVILAGKETASFAGHTNEVTSVVFSPDGSRLVSGSWDNTIKLWDTATGREPAFLAWDGESVQNVVFSPDGSRLASGSRDNMIKLWDTASGKELVSLVGHTKSVWSVAFSPDGSRLASVSWDDASKVWDTASGKEIAADAPALALAKQWRIAQEQRLSPDKRLIAEINDTRVPIVPAKPDFGLTGPLRAGLLALPGRALEFPKFNGPTAMIHYRLDTLAQLADPRLTEEKYAELRMELCTKSSQFRAATAQWQRLLQGEWPGFEGATVRKDQAPATIPADSPIRRLYLLALINATKHPQIHGHLTICRTAAQIVPVLTKEMMATPTISLAMMSLMQTLAKDDSPDMSAPRAALLKRLDEVATKEWLAVLGESSHQ